MKINKKGLLILIIAIIVIALGIGAYLLVNSKPVVWDGTYTMTGSLVCQGNFPNLTTIPMDTIIIVSGNKIVDEQTVQSFDINKRGKATQSEEITNQGITTKVTADYKFSNKGDVYKYTADGTATISAIASSTSYSSICTGILSGVKQ